MTTILHIAPIPKLAELRDSLFGPDLSQTSRYVDPNPNQGV